MKTLMTETIYKHTVTSLQHFLCPQKFIMSCHITGSIYTPNKTHRIHCYYITNYIFFNPNSLLLRWIVSKKNSQDRLPSLYQCGSLWNLSFEDDNCECCRLAREIVYCLSIRQSIEFIFTYCMYMLEVHTGRGGIPNLFRNSACLKYLFSCWYWNPHILL